MANQTETALNQTSLHLLGFLRLWEIIGDRKRGIQGLIPVSKTAWYEGIKSGKYPAQVKLGVRSVAWKTEDIRELIERLRN
ncbi:MAG: helix-turn-helix transcriptional regulator [Methylosarcina sp.]